MQTTSKATHAPPPPSVVHAGRLHIYFSSASILGDRSPAGAMANRAINRTQYCRTCDGTGETTKALDKWIEDRAKFAALGFDIDLYPPPQPEPEVCSTCKGKRAVNGARVPSARPKGSSIRTGVIEFGEEPLVAAGEATSIMMAVKSVSARYERALRLYYGDCGEWCLGELGDRLFGVIGEMTTWGQRAFERGLQSANDELRVSFTAADPNWRNEENFAYGVYDGLKELKLIATKGDGTQRVRYEAAYTEAYKLLLEASKAWDLCCEEH